jgi:uncharacterized protein YdhG (YjbR/CyaY superfamily)
MASSSSSRLSAAEAGKHVRTYLASLPAGARTHLLKMREAIRAAAPGAVESFGYGMPAFRIDGRPFIWYAAWKHHSSLYPLTVATARAHADALEPYETSGKGTVRFPLDAPPPAALIKRLVRARIAEVRATRR